MELQDAEITYRIAESLDISISSDVALKVAEVFEGNLDYIKGHNLQVSKDWK